jgi:acetylornithine/succinyldiaminopimelate/putrescine aminotransferase
VPGFSRSSKATSTRCEKAVDDEIAGIIMEPIQGEGGVNVPPADYPQPRARAVRSSRAHVDLR